MIKNSIFKTLLSSKVMSVQLNRFMADVVAKKLVIHEFGDPPKVVKMEEEKLPSPTGKNVLIGMLVASINPADMNCVQGTYPIKPKMPGVPGFEGVGKIEAVGEDVKGLSVGDHVIPDTEHLGTWRTHVIASEDNLLKIPSDVPLVEVAGISSNVSTAYRMLKDFVPLQPGDVVIQNGANSAAGQNVIQISKILGYTTVNIIRSRPEVDKLKDHLKELGATYVLTEEELRTTDMFKSGVCKPPKLGLNCVGGKSSTELIRKLGHGGIMVSYGAMSREPVIIPTTLFIFKDVSARGFWMTQWTRDHRRSESRLDMLKDLMGWMKEGKLKAPAHCLLPLDDYTIALENMSNPKGFSGTKYILDFRK